MRIWILLAAASFATACDDKPTQAVPEPPTEEAPRVDPATVSALQAAPPEASDEDIPTREDFEEEAEQSITAKNLPEQLDAIEKEIEAD